jgi:hypothetical protein
MKHCATFALSVILTSLSIAGASKASAVPIQPIVGAPHGVVVEVLCKYGTKNCVNPSPGPKPPKVGGARLPDSGWQDPDCKYYGNCNTGGPGAWGDPSIARKGPSGTHPGSSGPVGAVHTRH